MSAIAGVVSLAGRPADRRMLDAMAAALKHRAPDGTSVWADGCAGLIHGQLLTTPESARERQPFVDPSARLAITFDGRLDNRPELLAALDLVSPVDNPIGDAALTLAAYRAFGVASVDHLLGDFAFAIWDGTQRRLFCARDAMGLKPFCYRVDPHLFAWASEVGVLARHAGAVPAPNEGMAGEHLAGIVTSKHDTLFQNIYRLPPAHTLTVDAIDGAVQLRCYWQADPSDAIRYRRDEDYVEHLLVLMREAVAARLRATGQVAVSLSGGVDSASVTGIAAELCRARAVAATGIEAFLFVVPGPSDETEFFEQVTDRWGVVGHRVLAQPIPAGRLRAQASAYFDVPDMPNAVMYEPFRALMRQRGARVVLTGGDDWLGTSPWAYADLLKHGRLGSLAARLRRDAALEDFIGWPAAALATLWPLVPRRAKRMVRRALGRHRPPPWIDPAFAARISLGDRLAQHESSIPFVSYEQYDTWHEGTSGSAVHGLEMLDRATSRTGVEDWHPFLDRRIVEFGLAMPADQRWRDGRAKDLLRRAMASYVPPTVATRLVSPAGTQLIVRGIQTEGGAALVHDMAAARLGWVRQGEVRAKFDDVMRAMGTSDEGRGAVSLWHILALELWAKAVISGPNCG